MPSVQSEQIKRESQEIAALFDEEKRLVRALDLHFERYANRAKRQGKKRVNQGTLHHYDVPEPVIRQMRQELFVPVRDEAKQGLMLVDALWERRTREHRELAAFLLGELPAKSFRNVRARIQRWGLENREEGMIRAIAKLATSRMMEEDAPALLPLVKTMFRAADVRQRAIGLLILKGITDRGEMDLLPAILDMMIPLYRTSGKSLRPFLLETIESLIDRSPGEALYFLQQRLTESSDVGIRWLAKQSLQAFGPFERRFLEENLQENLQRSKA